VVFLLRRNAEVNVADAVTVVWIQMFWAATLCSFEWFPKFFLSIMLISYSKVHPFA